MNQRNKSLKVEKPKPVALPLPQLKQEFVVNTASAALNNKFDLSLYDNALFLGYNLKRSIQRNIPMASKERLYITVFNRISDLIKEGEFPVGSRLPTERELAERFQVSRPTIREAIIALEAKEEVSVKPSSGVYVLGNNLINDDFSHEITAFELLEARVVLEGEAAALAARMIQPEEVDELRKALRKIELEDVKDTSSSGADRQFHNVIAQATHNRVVAKQIHYLWDLQENLSHINRAHNAVCFEEDRERRIADHAAIFNAIAEGDANKARDAMREHFTDILEAMHAASEQEAVEAAKLKVSKMRERFKIA